MVVLTDGYETSLIVAWEARTVAVAIAIDAVALPTHALLGADGWRTR